MQFVTKYDEILARVARVDPVKYASSRNFIDGAVTYLSPYISRGVTSTRQVLDSVLGRGYDPRRIEKFTQELAWRDHWQQVWVSKGSRINNDLKHPQPLADRAGIPSNIADHVTGIDGIDQGIESLYETGYMHNHLRMYVASVACNVAKCHWKTPARWMYYDLLDADWASNALSWQWVAGSNSNKLYYANQENINKYCHTAQRGTFLDVGYDEFEGLAIPEILEDVLEPTLETKLPQTEAPSIDPNLPTLVYNFYNLDPRWRSNLRANRILLLEPSVFREFPVSEKSIEFCIALAKENIPEINVWVAEFSDLENIAQGEIYFKEHPLNNYVGTEDARTWMTNVKGDFSSFFAFWKKCSKELL